MENQIKPNQINYSSQINKKFLKNKLYFTLNYIACLVVGILIISMGLIFFGPMISITSIFGFLIILPIIFLISLITYLSLRYFELNKKKMLISMISLSLIISIFSFVSYYILRIAVGSLMFPLQEVESVAGLGSIGNIVELFNISITAPIIFSILTIFLYLLWPLISKKSQPEPL